MEFDEATIKFNQIFRPGLIEESIAAVREQQRFVYYTSMWRAYGDTALVVNNTPMIAITDLLAVFSVPVLYLSERGLSDHLSKITDAILINRTYLQGLGPVDIRDSQQR